MIVYTDQVSSITPPQLTGFFVGWPNPPNPETHLRVLQGSYRVWLALDADTQQVVGFINAISDSVLAAFIPLLEVLPDYHHQGIGSELTQRMLNSLSHLYSVDLLCDDALIPYYEKFGMRSGNGMMSRNYSNQSGLASDSD